MGAIKNPFVEITEKDKPIKCFIQMNHTNMVMMLLIKQLNL